MLIIKFCPICDNPDSFITFDNQNYECEHCGWEGSKKELVSRFKPQISLVLEELKALTDDERLRLFKHFCRHCGGRDPHCMCWNDD